MKPMGGGGGGMMKTVHRAVRAASGGHGSSQEPFSHSNFNHNCTTNPPTSKPTYKPSSSNKDSNTLSFLSNNHPSPLNHPNSAAGEEYGWFYDDSVFSTVPSMDEVDYAVSSLQQTNLSHTSRSTKTALTGQQRGIDAIHGRVEIIKGGPVKAAFVDRYVWLRFVLTFTMKKVLDTSTGSHESGLEFDWIEPSRSMMLQSRGSQSVYDAFHLLQTEPSVKRMVVSLSSDKSVWEAVMNNEIVRELRDSVYEAKKVESCDDDAIPIPIPVPDVRSGIFIKTKAKVMEIVEKITEMVNKLFKFPRNEKKDEGEGAATEPFETKLRSSFCLSVMVILIIVVSRVYRS